MNSRELGLVSSAFNSLLGTIGSQTTQQVDSTKSFNQILDTKVEVAAKKTFAKAKGSETQQVNREELSAKDSEYENDREAYVKSDMQKPKKAIAKAAKESTMEVSKENKLNASKETEKDEEVDALDVAEEVTAAEDVETIEENEVIKSIMELLTNDQLTDDEKLISINDLLSDLTSDGLTSLNALMKELKILLMETNGSLKDFEETLSKLKIDGSVFSSVLEELKQNKDQGLVSQLVEAVEKTILEAEGVQENLTKQTDLQESSLETSVETIGVEKNVEENPKETKAEQLKEAAEMKAEDSNLVADVTTTTSTNSQSNQQQSSAESNQTFVETLKFHNADVKTVAMKGAMASNPFEEKIMQQIIKGTQVSLNVGKDVSEMMIKLNPKDLGNVSLKISLENEQLVAKFNVENQTVKEVLESRLDDLRTALADKGFTIEGLDVSVDQDANEQFRSYEEFIKQQKSKRTFGDVEEIEGLSAIEGAEDISNKWQTLETTSSEINVLA